MTQWLAMRYVRPAFPDTFNHRLRDQRSQIRKLLKKEVGNYISGIFIAVAEEELPSGIPYEIRLWLSMPKSEYENPEKRKEAGKLLLDIEVAMSRCDGIEVLDEEESRCRSEEEISLHDLQTMYRLSSFDDLSFEDG